MFMQVQGLSGRNPRRAGKTLEKGKGAAARPFLLAYNSFPGKILDQMTAHALLERGELGATRLEKGEDSCAQGRGSIVIIGNDDRWNESHGVGECSKMSCSN
jgi:hypothetical protein